MDWTEKANKASPAIIVAVRPMAACRRIELLQHDLVGHRFPARDHAAADDQEALDELWTVYAEAIPVKPYASDAAVQAVINHLSESEPRYAEHKPAEFIDPGILSELDRSGYIDRLYAGKK